MGGFKDSGEREAAGENADAVHSGLVPILAAAGYTEPNSSSSSSSSDGGFLKAAAGSRRGSRLSQQGPAAGDVPAALPQAPAPAATQAANLNMRGAVIHCIGDLVQSIGVCIAGALIWWHQDDPRWALADPICTFLFAGLVLWTTAGISRDIIDVLMERVPRGMDVAGLRRDIEQVPGVAEVTDLHVWSLTPGIPLMAARVRLAKGAPFAPALRQLEDVCAGQGIRHCTIQPEQTL